MRYHKYFRPVLALLLALLLVLPQAAPAQAASSTEIKGQISDLKKENAVIQAEINAIRSLYNANASEIQAIVDQKDAIDQEIVLLNQQVININEQIAAYGQLIADTQDQLDVAEELLDTLSQQNRLRIQAMEEEGSVSYWEVLFQANSFTDLLDRLNMIEEIAAADQRRLEEMQLAAEMVERTRLDLTESMDELQTTRDDLALTQLMLEKAPREEVEAVLAFCCAVGLPVCFADMGYTEPDEQRLRLAAEKACVSGSTVHHMPFPVTADMIFDALLAADAAGSAYRKNI